MPSASVHRNPSQIAILTRFELLPILAIAFAVVLLHLLTNGHGFSGDELQFLSDARHMDWGFVAYPPLTPLLGRIGLGLFGLWPVGLRLFSVFAQATTVVVTGLMAKELGGKWLAQFTAALSVALSGTPLFDGVELQYSCFDLLWWVLIAYFMIRLLRTEDPRWWLAIGASAGLGLETKYAIMFFFAGILGGLALTRARRYFKSGWFWGGIILALSIFLPNFLWLVRHDFISYHFLQFIHARDADLGLANGFFLDQFVTCVNLIATPVWVTGLICYLRSPRYRMLAWMYLIPQALLYLAGGRFYYMAAAYPMLLAMGATAGEQWIAVAPKPSASAKKARSYERTIDPPLREVPLKRRALVAVFLTCLTLWGALTCAIAAPLFSSGPPRDFILKISPAQREEIGWDKLVQAVSGIYESLPPDQKASSAVLVRDYGEQGAIEMLGSAYHLPPPISVVNSGWLRGYPAHPPTTLIVLGFSQDAAGAAFTGCRLAVRNGNLLGVKNQESQKNPDILICGPPRLPWPEFWKAYQTFS